MKKTALKQKTPLRAKKGLNPKSKNPVKKKPKLKPLLKLRKDADIWFSRYVRLRDSEQDLQGDWYGTCITCPTTYLVVNRDNKYQKSVNAGHFVSRGHLVVRFDELNVNLQCVRCNKWKGGEYTKYRFALKEKYGNHVPEELEQLANDQKNYRLSREELTQVIHDAKECIDWMLREEDNAKED